MSDSFVFTKYKFGFDYRVWLVLIGVMLLSVSLLSYKIVTQKPPCNLVSIKLKGSGGLPKNSYYLGESVHFVANMDGASSVSWSFGDQSPAANGAGVTHSFMSEGRFPVTATVNGQCREIVFVTVQKLLLIRDSAGKDDISMGAIVGPSSPEVGEQVNFMVNMAASAYEWSILNASNFPIIKQSIATYSFATPGPRTLQLMLDNNPKKVITKEIMVLPSSTANLLPPAIKTDPLPPPIFVPKPQVEEKQPEKEKEADKPQPNNPVTNNPTVVTPAKKTVFLSDDLFQSFLEDLIEGKNDVGSFDEYLCSGGATKVMENGKPTTFAAFAGKISGNKKIKLRSVQLKRDENEARCVIYIYVNYKKTLL